LTVSVKVVSPAAKSKSPSQRAEKLLPGTAGSGLPPFQL
jgi:hypothetical protein